MNGPEVLIPLVGCVTFFGMICYVVGVIVSGRNRNRLAQIRAELQTRMLEKFGSAAEFVEFAKSEEGKKLLESAAMERPMIVDKNLTWLRRGILLTAAGVGVAILNLTNGIESGTATVSITLLSVGIGSIVAALSSRRLARAWQLESAPSEA